jgi:YD repeat-containing protein
MKNRKITETQTGMAARLLAACMLLIVAFGANAADYMQCLQAYQKSLGTPGTPTCAIQVAGTTPMSRGADDPYSSMNYYNCPNASDWIRDYCSGAPVPPSPEGSCPVADPVLPAEGIVTLSETDFASGDALPLFFGRTYLSRLYDTSQAAMGRNWVNNWQRRIDLTAVNASTPQIVAYRGNQQPLTFKWNGKAWATLGNRGLSLTKAGNGDYHLADELLGTTEVYSGNGNLYSETTRTGMLRKFGFDYRQRMVQINQWPVDQIGPNGFRINLQYDDSDRIVGMVDPMGKVTRYAYDVKGNLASVTHPDGSIRQYLYEDVRFPNALTGVKDESGSRIATWTYDAKARVISVSHPDTTRNTSFSYDSSKTTLSDMYGTSTYSFSFPDEWRPGSIVTPAGTISRKWDIAGNLTQRTTPEGDTQYTWDSANRPTKAIATVAGKKTVITIEYDDASSLRPHLVATPGKIRAFVYDSRGNVTGYAERNTTDLTGEQGLQAIGTGSQLTVGARYDNAGRLLSATITQNAAKIEDWTYTYDARGNIATTRDAVSGWSMRTLSRDAANRATAIAGNSGQADISYDERGRVSVFQYDEKAGVVNGGLARKLVVRYGYAANGTVSTRTATVAANGGVQQPISDAELGVWLTNWELGNDPVSPPANLTGLQSDSKAFVPGLCVECYMAWKAKLTGKLFGSELSEPLPKWGETTELMLSDQSQVPYPALVPDLTSSAKRSTLYSTLFGAGSGNGGMVKCGSSGDNEWREADCHAKYESDMFRCNSLAKYMGGLAGLALCKKNAFDDYQECRGR